ncbi:MAG: 5-formyltetrahydrofolate cyclo-ligase [Candidatus ainarchaeum sp.]|nr:5-formyltetrahydrofolate cyclo-ligase [Candidatus ainarchaeum sp.]
MKKLLRLQNLQKRNSLSQKEIIEKSFAIKERLFSLQEFKKSEKILFYVGIKSEARTSEMIGEALGLGKTVAVPLCDFEKKEMRAVQINSLDCLEEKKFGLLEPKTGKKIPVQEIDLIIVPGTAFDLKCERLGYGGGFFDRFLKKTKKSAKKIGLAFECNIEKKIPSTSRDVKMDKIITEKRIIIA